MSTVPPPPAAQALALPPAPCGGELLRVLRAAADGDHWVREPAFQQLQELERRPGFITLLLEAYAEGAAEPQGRLLAVVMCKNVAERQWQPRAGQGLSEEEKTQTKIVLLGLLRFAVAGTLPHLVELTLVLRKICRFDFPRKWDELAHFVLGELRRVQARGSFDEAGLAAVFVLHHVLKEQASKTLLAGKKELQQISEVMLEPLGAVWCLADTQVRREQSGQAVASVSHGQAVNGLGAGIVDDTAWKLHRYLDGCFLLLLTQGCVLLHESPKGPELIVLAKHKVTLLLALLRAHPQLPARCPFFGKNLKSVLKWWARLLKAQPLAFALANVSDVLREAVMVLQAVAAQVRVLARQEPQQRQLVEALTRSSLQLLTHALSEKAYRQGPGPGHHGRGIEAAQRCHAQTVDFLDRQSVGSLCELCCAMAFWLPDEEVRDWLGDPESQFSGPGARTELRAAGEAFVQCLCKDPWDQPLVAHIAARMNEELAQPPALGEDFERIVRRDAFLSLLALCQTQLKPYLQVSQLLEFSVPFANLALHGGAQNPSVLLPVRLCEVIKAWTAALPLDALPFVLQLLHKFLDAGCPVAVRLAALGPLNDLVSRFSDQDVVSQAHGPLIDSCLALLSVLKTPDVQWRCLNLVNVFLRDEAENGRYEVTERSLEHFLLLWRHSSEAEPLIRLAILDVLRGLVLMSCRSKQPHLPLSPPLLECCLAVVEDCYAAVKAAQSNGAAAAFGSGRDDASGPALLFESGNMLFIGVLRTVDVAQASPLMGLFPQFVAQYAAPAAVLQDGTMDALLEYCALCVVQDSWGPLLQSHYAALLRLCNRCLQSAQQDRNCELSLAMLQLLTVHAASPDSLGQVRELLAPLLQLWATTFDPKAPPAAFQYPLHSLLPVFCTWHARHPEDFRRQVDSSAPHVAKLMLACCGLVRPVPVRASLLAAALALIDDGGLSDGAVASDVLKIASAVLKNTDELVTKAQKKGPSALLSQSLQALKSSLATRLPAPARSYGELQSGLLPSALRPALRAEGGVDEASVVGWLVDRVAQALRSLGARSPQDLQALLAAVPPQLQGLLRAAGL